MSLIFHILHFYVNSTKCEIQVCKLKDLNQSKCNSVNGAHCRVVMDAVVARWNVTGINRS